MGNFPASDCWSLLLNLFDPQKIQISYSEVIPEILFLVDESESMLTPDINTSNNAAETRLSFAHSIIEDSQITDLEENASLTFQFFSSGQGKK